MASQDSANTDTNNQPVKTTPKDALVMAAILKEMGVVEYEPRIINQMVEFAYRYVTDIVSDARVYMTHASRKTINIDDIKLAVSQKLDHSFTSPPPREFLLDIARTKNSQPLPLIQQDRCGLRLPPERYCLTGNNYKVKSTTKKAAQRKGAASKASTNVPSLPGNIAAQKTSNPTPVPTTLNISAPTHSNGVSSTDAQMTNVTNSTMGGSVSEGVPSLLKRKREEDDDYDN